MKWAEINGHTYRREAVVVTSSETMPTFGKIVDIVISTHTLFVCKQYLTNCFNSHYHSYEVDPTSVIHIVKQSDLLDYHVLHEYKINFETVFIPMKYHIVEFL